MFKNTIKQFLYVTLQEKANAINILGKYVYCAGGSIARNSGAVNKILTIQGECVKKQRGKEQNGQKVRRRPGCGIGGAPDRKVTWNNLLYAVDGETIGRARSPDRAGAVRKQKIRAIPHHSKCRYGERGAADAKPKAQIILDAAKVSAASGGNSEPKQGQRSQSTRGFCPRSTMRVPQPDIIEHFGNADAVPQPPERCLSRQAGIVRCCLKKQRGKEQNGQKIRRRPGCGIGGAPDRKVMWNNLLYAVDGETIGRVRSPDRAGAVLKPQGGNCAVLP